MAAIIMGVFFMAFVRSLSAERIVMRVSADSILFLVVATIKAVLK